jgi:uncharacterized heparinase superfamily protein
MRESGLLSHIRRALEFGRHIPPRRVAQRVELQARRLLRDTLGSALPPLDCDADAAPRPPRPLFAPRTEQLQIGDKGYRFRFLNRTIEMDDRVRWDAPRSAPEDQLWHFCLHNMEYLEVVDDTTFQALVDSWICDNSPRRRGAWRDSFHAYIVSVRTLVWMQQLALRKPRLPADFTARMLASLRQQLMFLEHNVETYLGGNHLIKNIKGLIWGSAFFSGADAKRWRATGLKLLAGALREQVLRDGMHYERSVSYHCQVLADLLECRHALGSDPFSGALDEALTGMTQAAIDLAHPDGGVALFSDCGLSVAYSPSECLSVHQRLLGVALASRQVFALPSAGYYGLRHDDTYFVADCGPIAPDALMSHGHADVLSFEWSVAGRRIIVDQGVYEYNAGGRRQQSRGAASHNTLCFAGADQADFFGAFRCGRRPRAQVLTYAPGAVGFTLEGTHDGFCYLPGKPSHIRRFEVTRESVAIHDRIEGQPDRQAAIAFLLHPACAVSVADRQACIAQDGIEIVLDSTLPLKLEPAVWWPDKGVELSTHRLRAEFTSGERGAVSVLRVSTGH